QTRAGQEVRRFASGSLPCGAPYPRRRYRMHTRHYLESKLVNANTGAIVNARCTGVKQFTVGSRKAMSVPGTTRRSLAPLAIVTAVALLFALLLIFVRMQWTPLESVDHHTATWLNSLIAV